MSCAGIPISHLPSYNPPYLGSEVFAIAYDDTTYSAAISSLNAYFDIDDIRSLSGNWENTYNIVSNRVSYWDNIFKFPRWESTYTVVSQSSANWNSAYNVVVQLSGDWNDDIGGTVQATNGNLYNIRPRNEGEITGSLRGDHSLDLQTLRSNSDQVAKGSNSIVLGGRDNTAEADFSFVVGTSGTSAHTGSYVFADSTTVGFSSIADDTFNIQSDGLRLVDGNEAAGKLLVSDSNGTGNWSSTTGSLNVDGDLNITNGGILSSGNNLLNIFSIVQSITSDVEIGGINKTDVIQAGTTFQAFADLLLTKTYFPTFVLPSINIYDNLATNVEAGTTGIILTVAYNAGAINGDINNYIWDPNLKQADRAGAVNTYLIEGVNNGTNNVLELPGRVIGDGVNTFNTLVSYNSGPQPKDSKGNDYTSVLPAGTVTDTVNVYGKRKAFFGTNTPSGGDSPRDYGSSILGPVNGSTFTINIPAGAQRVVFAYPASLGDVSSVKYIEGLNAEVKSVFSQTVENVEGLNGYTAIPYKRYIFTPVNPFAEEVNYKVTI
jgi:hypothetical protein